MVEQRQRRYFLGANWKCNGTTAFAKDIVNHLINDLEYDRNKIGMSTQIIFRLNRFISIVVGFRSAYFSNRHHGAAWIFASGPSFCNR